MNKQERNKWVDLFIKFIISGFGTGYSPIVPGTFGTGAGVLIFLVIGYYPIIQHQWIFYLLITLILFVVGSRWGTLGEKVYYKKKDPGQIVIDEEVGYLITMAGSLGFVGKDGIIHPTNLILIFAGFVLFRIFDIVKPYPIRHLEKIEGGLGVMLDDVLAGFYSFICMMILQIYVLVEYPDINKLFIDIDKWIRINVMFF